MNGKSSEKDASIRESGSAAESLLGRRNVKVRPGAHMQIEQ